MKEARRFLTLLLLAMTLAFLFSTSVSYAADSGNSGVEIERIEMDGNTKTVYYTDGRKAVFFTISGSVNADVSVGTAHVHSVPAPPFRPPDITEILQIIKQILDLLGANGLGWGLLAWTIWNCVRKLRRNRPRDYYGVGTTFE